LLSVIPLLLPAEAHAALIYTNGGLSTGTKTGSGVSAPAGTTWSEGQNDSGNLAGANTISRLSALPSNFRVADDFTVPPGGVWTIQTIDFFSYKTGAPANPSPFAAYTLQVWDNDPSVMGSMVIFGDTTTNRMTDSVDALMFRVFN